MMDKVGILFFGCGTHRDKRMMSYILGKPEDEIKGGNRAVLEGYSLAIQLIDQAPNYPIPGLSDLLSVQSLLKNNWGNNFRSYAIIPNTHGKVEGIIWQLTPDDLEIIRYWELVDFGWYEDINVIVKTYDYKEIACHTVCLRAGQKIDYIIDTKEYDAWLQDHELYKIITEQSRKKYWQSLTKKQ